MRLPEGHPGASGLGPPGTEPLPEEQAGARAVGLQHLWPVRPEAKALSCEWELGHGRKPQFSKPPCPEKCFCDRGLEAEKR